MEIKNNIGLYIEEILEIAYKNYEKELKQIKDIKVLEKEHIKSYIKEKIRDYEGLVYIDESVQGYLLFSSYNEDDKLLICNIPVWGYGAVCSKREKVINMLFQKLAENMLSKNKEVHFQVNLFAHDEEIIRLFSFMQFGIQCETGIRYIDKGTSLVNSLIRELSKDELNKRWSEVWSLLDLLINHLRKSPVFYPGEEFTEEVYKDFFKDNSTRVFIAESKGEIIGIIEANHDVNNFIFGHMDSYNLGEAYVTSNYRGKGTAKELLDYASNALLKEGCNYQWVEHGTANPNARGFWNKYFQTYCYSMIRDIKPIK